MLTNTKIICSDPGAAKIFQMQERTPGEGPLAELGPKEKTPRTLRGLPIGARTTVFRKLRHREPKKKGDPGQF